MVDIDGILRKAEADEDVLAVVMFGSALNGNGRDVDVCLVMNKGVGDVSKKLMDYSGRVGGKIDLSIFQMLPIYVRKRVLGGNILFCRDYEKLCEVAFATLKEFGFYKKLYDMCLESVRNG